MIATARLSARSSWSPEPAGRSRGGTAAPRTVVGARRRRESASRNAADGARVGKPTARRTTISRRSRAPQVLGVVQPGQPGGQPLDGRLEVRVQVDEGPQLLGEPRQGDLVVTPACLELLDPSIGEVHPGALPGLSANAESSSARCCGSCTLAEPTDGAEDAGRVIGVSVHADSARPARQRVGQVQGHERPGTLVGRLVLHPEHLGHVRVTARARPRSPRSAAGRAARPG